MGYGRRIVMHYRKEKITGPTYKYPRFSEFINYILDRDLRYDDEHWSPFFKECTPCHINYNFIGHFETLYWDIHLLANKTGLVGQWDDKNDYFQSSRYKTDFDLFGYDAEDYIKMGKPGLEDLSDEKVKVEKNAEKTEAVKLGSNIVDSIKETGDEVNEVQSDKKPMT